VMVTSVPYAAEVVTRMYAGRADSENRIKELKQDLSLDTFCLKEPLNNCIGSRESA
jgi:hypothetical protein